ncbi:acetolactate decarboxylase [Methanospirillum sp.]|uniref:acetolactate decarboxylase n=1 Tax=Methanospirillum sp. TaxID=45200 RepID=UPI002CE80433|nr:acetolactate decarboxylase [Methanospirillum sp.]HPP76962.1 acetolactate decarboxylase [Methanospirillum sp.]
MRERIIHVFPIIICILVLMNSGVGLAEEVNSSCPLYQAGSFGLFEKGEYSEIFTVDDMNRLGDHGIGGFEDLNGELLQVDGRVYQITNDGVVHAPSGETGVCFANTVKFIPQITYAVNNMSSLEELYNSIQKSIPDTQQIYAVRINGSFHNITFRSIPAQNKPYPPLSDVIKNQSIFNREDANGTLVGFFYPEWMNGVNYAGFHLHFITDTYDAGGHILKAEPKEAVVSLEKVSELHLYLENKKEET